MYKILTIYLGDDDDDGSDTDGIQITDAYWE